MNQNKSGRAYRLHQLDLLNLNNILADIQRRLDSQDAIGQSPDFNGKRLANVGNPTQDGDAVNLRTLNGRISSTGTSGGATTTPILQLSDPEGLKDKDAVSSDYVVLFEKGSLQYKKARAIQFLVPTGTIVMWSGTLASIPNGYTLCDGTGGTPDLRDKFVYGWSDGVDPGDTGGTVNHDHSIDVPSHDHAVDVGSTTGGTPSATATVDNTGAGSTVAVASSDHTHDTDPASVTSGSTDIAAFDSETVDNLPPYYKLAFLMKI